MVRADLLIAADDGVELAVARGGLVKIPRILLQRLIAVLGGGTVGLAALCALR